MTKKKMHNRHNVSKGTVLAADLEELITRGPRRSMRSLAQEMSIFLTAVNTIVTEDLRYKIFCYEKGMKTGRFMSEASKTTLD